MKNFLKISGIIVLLAVLVVLFISIKMYNKPHIDVYKSAPEFAVTAGEIIGEFENDEQWANEKYLDKIVQVEGVVSAITTSSGNSVVTLDATGTIGTVISTMEPSQNKKILGLEKGSPITVKGICTGYIMDVMLVRAVIVD